MIYGIGKGNPNVANFAKNNRAISQNGRNLLGGLNGDHGANDTDGVDDVDDNFNVEEEC